MAVSKRLRYEILRRDNHACRYCGATAPRVKLNVDHVIPTSLGGSDKPDNLVTACVECNSGKTSSLPNAEPVADVEQTTFRRADELKRAVAQPIGNDIQIAFHAHLIAVWQWAWGKRTHTEPTEEEAQEAFEGLALLADGSDFTSDRLTEIAFKAGSARSTDITRFIEPQLSNEQFSLGADAVNRWSTSWEAASQDVQPSMDELAEFCDDLHHLVLLLDATAQRDTVMAAAARAGQARDTSITRHLSALRTVGGES
ncbi:HNH endonuclease [Streptomyces sp. NPDC091292]|uniref:HNH endonuclease n=1 Tax=Streptomyces sp. NPDC091292 TaxID=3365991 RepID=UPI00380B2982